MTIGDAIRKAMFDKRISARKTAKLSGLSNSMVSEYARGNVMPTFNAAAKLSHILDFSLDEVASFVEPTPQENEE